ncbi:MAG: hypothetical protein JWO38_122 [Gemmataceae bacterium]|nr:hypothetical protein [Gemmataceae bacterium]
MKKMIRPLAFAAALGVAGTLGTSLLSAEGRKPAAPPSPPAATPADPAKPAEAKPDAPMTPVKVTDARVETKTAVAAKPLSPTVKKGLEYLVKNQQEDGGWNQGGGWRTAVSGQGGRVEGANVEDPSDVGNTCFALLALFRAGNTPTEGEYKEPVAKGLKFILTRVEKADKDSLYVTDVRNTQLQSKIGPYVDTFLVNLVLAEMKGKAGSEEKRLTTALEKTMNKIVKHQTAEGGFANNGGWAPTLSVGIANKSFARAKQNGVVFDDKVLDRAFAQSGRAAAGTAAMPAAPADRVAIEGRSVTGPAIGPATKPSAGGVAPAAPGTKELALGGLPRGAAPAPAAFGAGGIGGGGLGGGDAGVRLYSLGQGAGNSQDVVNSLRIDGKKAQDVLKDAKASKEDKDKAEKKLGELRRAEKENEKVQENLAATVKNDQFVAGFGSNGGEEFLSFLNISEALLVKGGKDWQEWDTKMTTGLEKAQDKNGSWAGQHCITGKTFCTSAALLVLMADRTPFPVDVLKTSAAANEKKPDAPAPAPEKK